MHLALRSFLCAPAVYQSFEITQESCDFIDRGKLLQGTGRATNEKQNWAEEHGVPRPEKQHGLLATSKMAAPRHRPRAKLIEHLIRSRNRGVVNLTEDARISLTPDSPNDQKCDGLTGLEPIAGAGGKGGQPARQGGRGTNSPRGRVQRGDTELGRHSTPEGTRSGALKQQVLRRLEVSPTEGAEVRVGPLPRHKTIRGKNPVLNDEPGVQPALSRSPGLPDRGSERRLRRS